MQLGKCEPKNHGFFSSMHSGFLHLLPSTNSRLWDISGNLGMSVGICWGYVDRKLLVLDPSQEYLKRSMIIRENQCCANKLTDVRFQNFQNQETKVSFMQPFHCQIGKLVTFLWNHFTWKHRILRLEVSNIPLHFESSTGQPQLTGTHAVWTAGQFVVSTVLIHFTQWRMKMPAKHDNFRQNTCIQKNVWFSNNYVCFILQQMSHYLKRTDVKLNGV